MSTQSGGDGYGKVRKSCQTGGASGWAKHCGNTDDHKKSNRVERRLAKEQITEDDGVSRVRSSKRKRVPTRRHLVDRFKHVQGEIDQHEKDRKKHLEKKPKCKGCMMYCNEDHWYGKWRFKQRENILKEFEKYGYEKP